MCDIWTDPLYLGTVPLTGWGSCGADNQGIHCALRSEGHESVNWV
jgi:hypothetical protein